MYIIDNKVYFCPESAKLRPVNTDLFSKQLTTPGSKLLEGLIQSNGAILSYTSLYHIGWGEKHIDIKPNTLYQHLSTLRRAFNDCGIEGNWIVTHQRKGVSLNAHVLMENNLNMECSSVLDLHNHSPPENVTANTTGKKDSALRLFMTSMTLMPAVLLTGILDTLKFE